MPDPEALRAEVDTFMEAYDKRIAEVGLPCGRHHRCRVALQGDEGCHPVLVTV